MKNLLRQLSILTVMALFVFFSCNDTDKEDPLRVIEWESSSLSLSYPSSSTGSFTITGGVQPYEVSSGSQKIVKVISTENTNVFCYETQGIGETTIKIKDSSGQSLLLDVSVKYRERDFKITKHLAIVSGGDLTQNEIAEIEEQVFNSIPVKVGGGYKFIFTEVNSGELFVFPINYKGDYIGGRFYIEELTNENELQYEAYNLKFQDAEHNYFISTMPRSRSTDPLIQMAFYENLTEAFKIEYPNVEIALSLQGLEEL